METAQRSVARWTSGPRRTAILVVLLAGVLAGAFLLGQRNPRVVVEEAGCLSAKAFISCELADGWTIGVPRDVWWTDASGDRHDGGRPTCLPPTGIGLEGPVRLAWTSVEVDGTSWRQVLSVTCLE